MGSGAGSGVVSGETGSKLGIELSLVVILLVNDMVIAESDEVLSRDDCESLWEERLIGVRLGNIMGGLEAGTGVEGS